MRLFNRLIALGVADLRAAVAVMVVLPASAQQQAAKPTMVTAAGVTLHSGQHVDLPTTAIELFPGPDADPINNNCLACHSAGMVLNQPGQTATVWHGEELKRCACTDSRRRWREEDVPAIVAYLAAHQGVP